MITLLAQTRQEVTSAHVKKVTPEITQIAKVCSEHFLFIQYACNIL